MLQVDRLNMGLASSLSVAFWLIFESILSGATLGLVLSIALSSTPDNKRRYSNEDAQ